MSIVPISTRKTPVKARTGVEIKGEHIQLVARIARRVRRRLPPSFDVEDLVGAGYIGLLKASRSYDAADYPDVPFHVFATHRIRGEMLEISRRKQYAENTRPGLDEMPEELLARENVVGIEIDAARLTRRLRDAIAALPDEEREIIERLYLSGQTPAQIDGRAKLLRPPTRELRDRALLRLREKIAA